MDEEKLSTSVTPSEHENHDVESSANVDSAPKVESLNSVESTPKMENANNVENVQKIESANNVENQSKPITPSNNPVDIGALYNMQPPAKFIAQSRLGRVALAYLIITITAIVLMGIALLSSILGPIIYTFVLAILFVAVIAIVIFSIGTVLLVPDNIVSKLWAVLTKITGASDSMMNIAQFCFNAVQWIALAGIISSVVAIVFNSIHKGSFKVLKIIVLSILLVLFILTFILYVLTGGMQV